MNYILDTNIVADLLKNVPSTYERLTRLKRNQVFLPQPVLAEIEFGLSRLGHSERQNKLRNRYHILLQEIPRATWNDFVSQSFGLIKAHLQETGQLIEDFDIAIAAHAHAKRGTLVTHNVRHFNRIENLLIEEW